MIRKLWERADYIIDIGPNAGKNGGEIIFEGSYNQMIKKKTLTSKFLNGSKRIEVPNIRRKKSKKNIKLTG